MVIPFAAPLSVFRFPVKVLAGIRNTASRLLEYFTAVCTCFVVSQLSRAVSSCAGFNAGLSVASLARTAARKALKSRNRKLDAVVAWSAAGSQARFTIAYAAAVIWALARAS